MAMIADAFVGKLVNRLAAFVEEKVILVLGVKDELQRLQRRLWRIHSVLKDAERRIEDEAVNHWLDELKGVMYDADDRLDRCRLEGGKLLDDQSSKSSSSSSTLVPPLGELPRLKTIKIIGASAVVSIGPEFIGAAGVRDLTSTAFPKLEFLGFADMANWKEWSFGGEENRSLVFPRLRKLVLYQCPNLRALPKGLELATALHELHFFRNSSLEGIPSLFVLKVFREK